MDAPRVPVPGRCCGRDVGHEALHHVVEVDQFDDRAGMVAALEVRESGTGRCTLVADLPTLRQRGSENGVVVGRHETEVLEAAVAGASEEIPVQGRRVVALVDQLDLELTAVAQGDGHIGHGRGATPVVEAFQREGIEHVPRANSGGQPALERPIEIADDVTQLPYGAEHAAHSRTLTTGARGGVAAVTRGSDASLVVPYWPDFGIGPTS